MIESQINVLLPPENWNDCTFQNGLCGWELSGAIDDQMFYWNLTDGHLLQENQLTGPTKDHLDSDQGK